MDSNLLTKYNDQYRDETLALRLKLARNNEFTQRDSFVNRLSREEQDDDNPLTSSIKQFLFKSLQSIQQSTPSDRIGVAENYIDFDCKCWDLAFQLNKDFMIDDIKFENETREIWKIISALSVPYVKDQEDWRTMDRSCANSIYKPEDYLEKTQGELDLTRLDNVYGNTVESLEDQYIRAAVMNMDLGSNSSYIQRDGQNLEGRREVTNNNIQRPEQQDNTAPAAIKQPSMILWPKQIELRDENTGSYSSNQGRQNSERNISYSINNSDYSHLRVPMNCVKSLSGPNSFDKPERMGNNGRDCVQSVKDVHYMERPSTGLRMKNIQLSKIATDSRKDIENRKLNILTINAKSRNFHSFNKKSCREGTGVNHAGGTKMEVDESSRSCGKARLIHTKLETNQMNQTGINRALSHSTFDSRLLRGVSTPSFERRGQHSGTRVDEAEQINMLNMRSNRYLNTQGNQYTTEEACSCDLVAGVMPHVFCKVHSKTGDLSSKSFTHTQQNKMRANWEKKNQMLRAEQSSKKTIGNKRYRQLQQPTKRK